MACHTFDMPNKANEPTPTYPSEYYGGAYRGFEHRVRWASKDGHEWSVSFTVDNVDGRLSLTNLSVAPVSSGYALTQTILRDMPIAEWEREALAGEATHLATLTADSASAPHSGRRHSDEELRRVADIYMAALNARQPVQKTVAEALGLSLSTATKRIVAARKKGYIPPANRKEANG